MTPTLTTDPRVHQFAEAVRAQLRDLSAEEVEDLTDGLEADLDEHARENDDFEFGDPGTYANELRESAGLPAQTDARHSALTILRLEAGRVLTSAASELRASPTGARVLSFFVSLRPVWWVMRAIIGFTLFELVYLRAEAGIPVSVFIFTAFLVLSVQWGRGRWAPQTWLRVLRTIANVAAIVAAPFVIGFFISSATNASYGQNVSYDPPQGLSRNGNSITNVFAYDANGEPLTGVQLFDQDGKPLSAKLPYQDYLTTNDEIALVPNRGATNGNGWNVFPFDSVSLSAINPNTNRPYSSAVPSAVTPPFAQVQPLAKPAPVRDGSGVTSARPSASPSPAPSGPAPAAPTVPVPSDPAAP